jgi:hypothetical protein
MLESGDLRKGHLIKRLDPVKNSTRLIWKKSRWNISTRMGTGFVL